MRVYKETLNGTATVQRYLKSMQMENGIESSLGRSWIVSDSQERESLKNEIWTTHVGLFAGVFIFTYLFLLIIPDISFWCSLCVTSVMAFTVMTTIRWAWDYRLLFPMLILGGVPFRIGLGLALSSMILSSGQVDPAIFIFSMMFYWVVFTAIEISLALNFFHKVKWIN